MVTLQIPSVQSRIASRLAEKFSRDINGTLTIGSARILPFKTLIIKDVILTDDHPVSDSYFTPRDTVLNAGLITVSFSLRNLIGSKPIVLSRVKVRNATFNYVIEGILKDNITRILGGGGGSNKLQDNGDVFRIKNFATENFRITMVNSHAGHENPHTTGIDWLDMDLTADIKGHDIRLVDASVRLTVDDVKAEEKCGYRFLAASGDVVVHSGHTEVFNAIIDDQWSHLLIPYFAMTYEDYRAFLNFTEEVKLEAKVENATLGSPTLQNLAGLPLPELSFHISKAEAEGTLDQMRVKQLNLKEKNGLSASLEARMDGLGTPGPDTRINAKINTLAFTTAELGTILESYSPGISGVLGKYIPRERLYLKGNVNGPLSDLLIDCTATSGVGDLSGRIKVKDLTSDKKPVGLKGAVSLDGLHLGKILNSDILGQCTLDTGIDATLSGDSYDISIDSLQIGRLHLLGYDYQGIAGAGTFKDDIFNGRVICTDPNLNFLFQGIFNLSNTSRNALYKFYFNLGYADLNALHLDNRGPSKASAAVNANFTRIKKGDVIGDIDIRSIKLENKEGKYDIGDISVKSFTANASHRVNLSSSFAKGSFTGTKSFPDMLAALEDVTLTRELPALTGKKPSQKSGDDFRLSLTTFDSRDLLAFVMPGLYIADGTALNLHIDKKGNFDSELNSQRIAFEDKYLKDLTVKALDRGNGLNLTLRGNELSAGSVKLLANSVEAGARADSISLNYRFDNAPDFDSFGDLSLFSLLDRNEDGRTTFELGSNRSLIHFKDENWEIDPSSRIKLLKDGLQIPFLAMGNRHQRLECSGGVSNAMQDTLTLTVNKLGLGIIGKLASGLPAIDGIITGRAELISPVAGNRFSLVADLISEATSLSGYDAGTLKIQSRWDEEREGMDFSVNNVLRGRNTLSSTAFYKPSSKEINARINMDSLQIGYAGDLLKEVFSEMEGKASGEVSLAGPTDRLSVFSRNARIDDGMVRVAYTDVPYYVSGPFHINDSGVFFDDMDLRDRFDGTGKVGGGISFKHFKDFVMDTRITAENAEVFNKSVDGETPIYGNVFGTGTVVFRGPFEDLLMDVDARTEKNGDFHIPLRAYQSLGSTDLLTFKAPDDNTWEDPYEKMMSERRVVKNDKSSFGIRMKIAVSPVVECNLEIDKESGNVLIGRGYGDLLIGVDGPEFNINGDYNLSNGNFHFNAMNIASRNFNIRSGSSIKFNGDIMESDLDIDATYITKASLANLVADTTAVTSRRSVECGLKISDKLKNPQIDFSIDIPDLDPSTKSSVENALSTEDKLQKQFLALLVTNSFIPDDQGGIFNSSNLLVSNVMEVMSGQLNNILQSLQIPLDLGLKYQMAEGGTDIFDLAVSTQLFNNRVSVNGIIGNRQYSTDESGRDMVGDLDIDFKLDKAGALRLKLFSHSADKYSNYLDYSQRNGVGIGYQKEFNTFRDLFRRKKNSQDSAEKEEKTTISINADE